MAFKSINFRGFILLIFLIQLTSCVEKTEKKEFRIGFSQCCSDPWRDIMEQEMQMEMSFHPEVAFEMAVAGNSSETQITQIRALVAG